MENSAAHIPAEVFDWIEQYSFSELDSARQDEVLRYLSQEEYEELHLTVTNIKTVSQEEKEISHENSKQLLLERFDRYHEKQASAPGSRYLFFWKAASILLLFCSGWLGYHAISQKSTSASVLAAIADTVYITKEVAAASVTYHDTIYITRKEKASRKRDLYAAATGSNSRHRHTHTHTAPSGDISIVTVKDLENISNRTKGTSMKDDSIARKYSFVTL